MRIITSNQSDLFLITRATGNVGRHIVDQLLQKGQQVRALTRNPDKADLPAEAEVVQGDLTRPETIRPVLEGVAGIHLITISGDSFEPLQTGPEMVKMAGEAEVQQDEVSIMSKQEKAASQQITEEITSWPGVDPSRQGSEVYPQLFGHLL